MDIKLMINNGGREMDDRYLKYVKICERAE
jgi:hypothetical protein